MLLNPEDEGVADLLACLQVPSKNYEQSETEPAGACIAAPAIPLPFPLDPPYMPDAVYDTLIQWLETRWHEYGVT